MNDTLVRRLERYGDDIDTAIDRHLVDAAAPEAAPPGPKGRTPRLLVGAASVILAGSVGMVLLADDDGATPVSTAPGDAPDDPAGLVTPDGDELALTVDGDGGLCVEFVPVGWPRPVAEMCGGPGMSDVAVAADHTVSDALYAVGVTEPEVVRVVADTAAGRFSADTIELGGPAGRRAYVLTLPPQLGPADIEAFVLESAAADVVGDLTEEVRGLLGHMREAQRQAQEAERLEHVREVERLEAIREAERQRREAERQRSEAGPTGTLEPLLDEPPSELVEVDVPVDGGVLTFFADPDGPVGHRWQRHGSPGSSAGYREDLDTRSAWSASIPSDPSATTADLYGSVGPNGTRVVATTAEGASFASDTLPVPGLDGPRVFRVEMPISSTLVRLDVLDASGEVVHTWDLATGFLFADAHAAMHSP